MLAENDSFYHLIKRSLSILQHAFSSEPEERLLVEGARHVVAQPEFRRNPQKAHQLLKSLDHEDLLLRRITEDISHDGVAVRIGHEVQVPGLEECSYIAVPFAVHEELLGGIGILGPKRMEYARLRTIVEAMAQSITELLQ